jgi:hypothetical protein
MVVKYFYDGSVIQLCIYRMLDASILLKLEGCVATRTARVFYHGRNDAAANNLHDRKFE